MESRKATFWTQVDSSRLSTWTEDGQKIQKKTRRTIALHFGSTTGQQHNFLYALGSNSRQKFDCSKFLRSNQTDTEYVCLLHRLSRNIGEPHRSRAQHVYPTLGLRCFASHSILSVSTNSPHFDKCIPSWVATSSDSRFSVIITQYWWKLLTNRLKFDTGKLLNAFHRPFLLSDLLRSVEKHCQARGLCVCPVITNKQWQVNC